jgi:hypothetical protein
MDQPLSRLSVISVRLSIITVRPSRVPAVRLPELPSLRRPELPAVPRPPSNVARRLAIAAVLAAAVVLFATVPAWVAHLIIDSGIWDLARSVTTRVASLDLSSHALPLLIGSIVVLAAMSSSSGPHGHDPW